MPPVADEITIGTITVTLNPGNSTTLTFVWNTMSVTKNNYTVSAVGDTISGETQIENNIFIDDWVIVAMLGDVTGPEGLPDGEVDIRDIASIAKLFGVIYPDPGYNANYDLTGPISGIADGKIDIRDIAPAASHFGEIDP